MDEIHASCSQERIGCKDCKGLAGEAINNLLVPFRERRNDYKQRGDTVKEILIEGTRKARKGARNMMLEVREAMDAPHDLQDCLYEAHKSR
ncbi:Tryptophanyl-tRNA synthetase [Paenibacillus xylanexedens]|nr:Tryptophanyl-tRNA synthetase [Paenibacillus xylanexedens]